jgi:signal transduction histidine kinase
VVPQSSVNPLFHPERRSVKRRHVDQQLIQREKELEAARRICDALFQHTDVDKIVEMALRTALEVLGVEVGSILLANPDTKQLVFRHSLGVNPVSRGTSMPWDRGIAGSVFKSGKPEVVADAGRDDRHYSQVDKLTGFESHDMIVFPLKRWEGDPIGVLEVLNKRNGRLEDDALAILSIISAFTAFSIEQARLFQEAKLAEVARLTGDISHDIKNLLMPVVTGADLLEMELSDLCTKLAPWDAKQADSSRATCNDILAMLREDAGRIQDRVKEVADCVKGLSAPPVFAPCRLAEVVGSVLKTLRLMAEEKKIALHAEGLDALPTIQADARRLYNAFYNLVNNAIPEVPPDGSITVRGQNDPARDAVCVAVADTGRGMPQEIRDSLFSSRAISRKPGGTGLGTKIVKDVVDAHRGQITVESTEGIGTTFLIRLPLHPPDISATSLSTVPS